LNHRPRKRFGQNFLVDANIIDKIIACIDPAPDDHIIEIGPGLGALTQPLLDIVHRLDVIELDRDVIPKLNKLASREALQIHNIDVLAFDFTAFQRSAFNGQKIRVIGNLPYNISTAILFHLIQHRTIVRDMHFMLQKEVVERIAADVGSHDYGRLSVMMQLHFSVNPLFTVAAGCFRPVPKVESAVVRLTPYPNLPISSEQYDAFSALVRQAFSHRRKTLKNTLKGVCAPSQIHAAGIDPGKRPQELDISDYLNLFRQIEEAGTLPLQI
jgi:16S rRNA (adenine1518-N6/adenine1519-N6)-dimethyltransferase